MDEIAKEYDVIVLGTGMWQPRNVGSELSAPSLTATTSTSTSTN